MSAATVAQLLQTGTGTARADVAWRCFFFDRTQAILVVPPSGLSSAQTVQLNQSLAQSQPPFDTLDDVKSGALRVVYNPALVKTWMALNAPLMENAKLAEVADLVRLALQPTDAWPRARALRCMMGLMQLDYERANAYRPCVAQGAVRPPAGTMIALLTASQYAAGSGPLLLPPSGAAPSPSAFPYSSAYIAPVSPPPPPPPPPMPVVLPLGRTTVVPAANSTALTIDRIRTSVLGTTAIRPQVPSAGAAKPPQPPLRPMPTTTTPPVPTQRLAATPARPQAIPEPVDDFDMWFETMQEKQRQRPPVRPQTATPTASAMDYKSTPTDQQRQQQQQVIPERQRVMLAPRRMVGGNGAALAAAAAASRASFNGSYGAGSGAGATRPAPPQMVRTPLAPVLEVTMTEAEPPVVRNRNVDTKHSSAGSAGTATATAAATTTAVAASTPGRRTVTVVRGRQTAQKKESQGDPRVDPPFLVDVRFERRGLTSLEPHLYRIDVRVLPEDAMRANQIVRKVLRAQQSNIGVRFRALTPQPKQLDWGIPLGKAITLEIPRSETQPRVSGTPLAEQTILNWMQFLAQLEATLRLQGIRADTRTDLPAPDYGVAPLEVSPYLWLYSSGFAVVDDDDPELKRADGQDVELGSASRNPKLKGRFFGHDRRFDKRPEAWRSDRTLIPRSVWTKLSYGERLSPLPRDVYPWTDFNFKTYMELYSMASPVTGPGHLARLDSPSSSAAPTVGRDLTGWLRSELLLRPGMAISKRYAALLDPDNPSVAVWDTATGKSTRIWLDWDGSELSLAGIAGGMVWLMIHQPADEGSCRFQGYALRGLARTVNAGDITPPSRVPDVTSNHWRDPMSWTVAPSSLQGLIQRRFALSRRGLFGVVCEVAANGVRHVIIPLLSTSTTRVVVEAPGPGDDESGAFAIARFSSDNDDLYFMWLVPRSDGTIAVGKWMVRYAAADGWLTRSAPMPHPLAGHELSLDWLYLVLRHDAMVLDPPEPPRVCLTCERLQGSEAGAAGDTWSVVSQTADGSAAMLLQHRESDNAIIALRIATPTGPKHDREVSEEEDEDEGEEEEEEEVDEKGTIDAARAKAMERLAARVRELEEQRGYDYAEPSKYRRRATPLEYMKGRVSEIESAPERRDAELLQRRLQAGQSPSVPRAGGWTTGSSAAFSSTTASASAGSAGSAGHTRSELPDAVRHRATNLNDEQLAIAYRVQDALRDQPAFGPLDVPLLVAQYVGEFMEEVAVSREPIVFAPPIFKLNLLNGVQYAIDEVLPLPNGDMLVEVVENGPDVDPDAPYRLFVITGAPVDARDVTQATPWTSSGELLTGESFSHAYVTDRSVWAQAFPEQEVDGHARLVRYTIDPHRTGRARKKKSNRRGPSQLQLRLPRRSGRPYENFDFSYDDLLAFRLDLGVIQIPLAYTSDHDRTADDTGIVFRKSIIVDVLARYVEQKDNKSILALLREGQVVSFAMRSGRPSPPGDADADDDDTATVPPTAAAPSDTKTAIDAAALAALATAPPVIKLVYTSSFIVGTHDLVFTLAIWQPPHNQLWCVRVFAEPTTGFPLSAKHRSGASATNSTSATTSAGSEGAPASAAAQLSDVPSRFTWSTFTTTRLELDADAQKASRINFKCVAYPHCFVRYIRGGPLNGQYTIHAYSGRAVEQMRKMAFIANRPSDCFGFFEHLVISGDLPSDTEERKFRFVVEYIPMGPVVTNAAHTSRQLLTGPKHDEKDARHARSAMFTGPRRTRADRADASSGGDDDDDADGGSGEGKEEVRPAAPARAADDDQPPPRQRRRLDTEAGASGSSGSAGSAGAPASAGTQWGSAGAPPPPRQQQQQPQRDPAQLVERIAYTEYPKALHGVIGLDLIIYATVLVNGTCVTQDRVHGTSSLRCWSILLSNEVELCAPCAGPPNTNVFILYTTPTGLQLLIIGAPQDGSNDKGHLTYVTLDALRNGGPIYVEDAKRRKASAGDCPMSLDTSRDVVMDLDHLVYTHADYPFSPSDRGDAGPFLRLRGYQDMSAREKTLEEKLDERLVLALFQSKGYDLGSSGTTVKHGAIAMWLIHAGFVSGTSDIACVVYTRGLLSLVDRTFVVRIMAVAGENALEWKGIAITAVPAPSRGTHDAWYGYFSHATIQYTGDDLLRVFDSKGKEVQGVRIPHHRASLTVYEDELVVHTKDQYDRLDRVIRYRVHAPSDGPKPTGLPAAASTAAATTMEMEDTTAAQPQQQRATPVRPGRLTTGLSAATGQYEIANRLLEVSEDQDRKSIFGIPEIVSLVTQSAGERVTHVGIESSLGPYSLFDALTGAYLVPLAVLPDASVILCAQSQFRQAVRLRQSGTNRIAVAVAKWEFPLEPARFVRNAVIVGSDALRLSYVGGGYRYVVQQRVSTLFPPEGKVPLAMWGNTAREFTGQWSADGKLVLPAPDGTTVAAAVDETVIATPAFTWWMKFLDMSDTTSRDDWVRFYRDLTKRVPLLVARALPPEAMFVGLGDVSLRWVMGTRDILILMTIAFDTGALAGTGSGSMPDALRLIIRIPEHDGEWHGQHVVEPTADSTPTPWSTYLVSVLPADGRQTAAFLPHAIVTLMPDNGVDLMSYSSRRLRRIREPIAVREPTFYLWIVCYPISATRVAMIIGETETQAPYLGQVCRLHYIDVLRIDEPLTDARHARR